MTMIIVCRAYLCNHHDHRHGIGKALLCLNGGELDSVMLCFALLWRRGREIDSRAVSDWRLTVCWPQRHEPWQALLSDETVRYALVAFMDGEP
jgi:hypothetical protein